MFDAAGMFPKGFHASVWGLDASGGIAEPLRRRDVPPVRYFFTDFGLSTRYLEGESRLALGRDGLDQEVPELSDSEPYDPFAVDVFVLGNVFKRNFLEVRNISIYSLLFVLKYHIGVYEYGFHLSSTCCYDGA